MKTIVVDRDFSHTPGSRFIEDGPYSAEVFYAQYVRPAFEKALANGEDLHIDLDGTAGYATSFLQGTFGTLAHDFTTEVVRSRLSWKNEDDPSLDPLIKKYIREAKKVEKVDSDKRVPQGAPVGA